MIYGSMIRNKDVVFSYTFLGEKKTREVIRKFVDLTHYATLYRVNIYNDTAEPRSHFT